MKRGLPWRWSVAASAAAVAGAVVAPAAAQSAVSCGGRPAEIVGTAGDDFLEGTDGSDVIAGLEGNDTIRGLDGLDFVCGGPGDDDLDGHGPPLPDVLHDTFDDTVYGDDGNDFLRGGIHAHALHGGPGDDTFVRGPVSFEHSAGGVIVDLATGDARGEGSDTLLGVRDVVGSPFDDQILGSENTNVVGGGAGNDVLFGDGDVDHLFGDEGDDNIAGGDDDDLHLWGGDGDDFVSGDEGDDLLAGDGSTVTDDEAGDDFLWGGSGDDRAEFGLLDLAVRVDLLQEAATGQGHDRLESIEEVEGSSRDDWIRGDALDNDLQGMRGADVVIGGRGDDRVDAADYDGIYEEGDVARGGRGDDTLYAKECCTGTPLRGGPGLDTISFAGGFIAGPEIRVVVDFRTDSYRVGRRSGTFAAVEGVYAGGASDRIIGDRGRNLLYGSWGKDLIRGLGGNDVLVGGRGVDALDGGAGRDECREWGDARRRCEFP